MMIRSILFSALFLLAGAASAAPLKPQDVADLAKVSAYLNAITSLKSSFVQVGPNGELDQGVLYARKPGRLRFEYAPPEQSLVMAGGGQVAIFDAKSNQPPEQYPLRRTPLNLILARNVDLGQAKMVVGHYEAEGTTRVVAQDPEHPEYGTIELVFSPDPIALRQWTITDEQGGQTTVMEFGGSISAEHGLSGAVCLTVENGGDVLVPIGAFDDGLVFRG